MEDLEKDLEQTCDCCEDCKCEKECNCDENDKCCEECSCCEDCDCKVESDAQTILDNSDEQSGCTQDTDCEDKTQTEEETETEEEIQPTEEIEEENCICDESVENEDEKCKCGCGETVEQESVADAYFKQLLSLRAEFDNYRKRTQNDIAKAYSNGFNQAITEFLPALDSFKMATEYITDANTLMGIQYIEKGILNTLEKIGVKAIDVSGKFDPNFHQAIGSEVSSEHESGDIIKECFKGFIMGDKVIRYSQVIVAK